MRIPRFIKDSGTLVSGHVTAQLIAFAAYPLLTRLFTPEDFGLYNVFYSYIEVFIILSTCKYELSIVTAESEDEARAIARLTLRLNSYVSLLLLTVVLVLTLLGVHLGPLMPSLALLIPFMVFFCGTTRVYGFLYNRWKQYRPIATGEVLAGELDGDDTAKVRAWISIHREDLFANWQLLIEQGTFFKIDPLR